MTICDRKTGGSKIIVITAWIIQAGNYERDQLRGQFSEKLIRPGIEQNKLRIEIFVKNKSSRVTCLSSLVSNVPSLLHTRRTNWKAYLPGSHSHHLFCNWILLNLRRFTPVAINSSDIPRTKASYDLTFKACQNLAKANKLEVGRALPRAFVVREESDFRESQEPRVFLILEVDSVVV